MRVQTHPILGKANWGKKITLMVDGKEISAFDGEPLAVALMNAGIYVLRYTSKGNSPRGVFCALGRCTDCVMTVNGQPNTRTCITPSRDGMIVETQVGQGAWRALGKGSGGEGYEKD
jgi:predicted molibdopterin-dependent oxidoreductase YjgC